jgi:hypothetical protein
MGEVYDSLEGCRAFIEAQHIFFVATAPDTSGHVNLSPKGLDTLRIVGPRTVVYLDHVGSGAETIAHLRQNGRIAMMFCALEGPPKIVRLHGRGHVVEPTDAAYADLRRMFAPSPAGRAIIRVVVDRISDSCGYGVPLYRYEGQREQLRKWASHKGERGLQDYQHEKNRTSIDGLPAVTWVRDEPI